jgi:hypothetical protein
VVQPLGRLVCVLGTQYVYIYVANSPHVLGGGCWRVATSEFPAPLRCEFKVACRELG